MLKKEDSPLLATAGPSAEPAPRRRLFACDWTIIGPGILVALADTDFACLLEAADSGARFEYSFLMGLQILLFPVLFMTQELTVRLGVHTHQGHGACIRAHFGVAASWLAFTLLAISCTLATMSELAGIAGVAGICGLHGGLAATLSALLLLGLIFLCPYRVVEKVGILFGLFECSFLVSCWLARPDAAAFFSGVFRMQPDSEFSKLIAANVGAVIMPWMVYFQQSAVAAKHADVRGGASEASERTGTLVGSVVTQLIMLGTMITFAASRDATQVYSIENVAAMGEAMDGAFGSPLGRVLLALGLFGGSVCAAIVVALAASWALVDSLGDGTCKDAPPPPSGVFRTVRADESSTASLLIFGRRAGRAPDAQHDAKGGARHGASEAAFEAASASAAPAGHAPNPMDVRPWEAPAFYGFYSLTVLSGLIVVLFGASQEAMTLLALVSNAFLMPVTLAFLWLLATGEALPEAVRVKGLYKWFTALVFFVASLFSLVATVHGVIQ